MVPAESHFKLLHTKCRHQLVRWEIIGAQATESQLYEAQNALAGPAPAARPSYPIVYFRASPPIHRLRLVVPVLGLVAWGGLGLESGVVIGTFFHSTTRSYSRSSRRLRSSSRLANTRIQSSIPKVSGVVFFAALRTITRSCCGALLSPCA